MVTMVWVVGRLRLKGPSWYLIFIYISPLTSLGQCSCTSWATQPPKSATLSPQPGGKTTKFVWTCGGIGEKKKVQTKFVVNFIQHHFCSLFRNLSQYMCTYRQILKKNTADALSPSGHTSVTLKMEEYQSQPMIYTTSKPPKIIIKSR